jgi:hypothetical protein
MQPQNQKSKKYHSFLIFAFIAIFSHILKRERRRKKGERKREEEKREKKKQLIHGRTKMHMEKSHMSMA